MCSRKWERVGKGWVKGAGAQGSRGWLPEGLAGGPSWETHYEFQSVHPLPCGLGTGWRQGAGGRKGADSVDKHCPFTYSWMRT